MAKRIAKEVDKIGGSTYYVGGYVRDKILKRSNKDIDIEVHGISSEQLSQILSHLGTVKTQGASFGVYNLHGYDIDIAQPRTETATGRGHKDFEVFVDPFIGTEKAAKRRDFTMNALMENVLTGEVIDHYGGVDDLKNGIIRHVDDITFKEDPLRVLRAAQFAARFGFKIAPETKEVMKDMDLSTLSRERIYGEMSKALMKSEKPSVFFEELKSINQLNYWFPEIKALDGCKQNEKYHPEGDVWVHTMRTVDYAAGIKDKASNPEFYMVSALLHDVGKPLSVSVDSNGVSHSYEHEKLGVDVVGNFLDRINNDVHLRKYVSDMTLNHMKPHVSYQNKSALKSTNRMFDKCENPHDLVLLVEADTGSKGDIEEAKSERTFLLERLCAYEARMKEPEVTGADLIKLGMKPGPQFSEVLANTHRMHLSYVSKDKVLKDVTTKFAKVQRKLERESQMKRTDSANALLENLSIDNSVDKQKC